MYLGNAMLPSKQTRLKQNLIAKVTNLIENAKEKLQKDKICIVECVIYFAFIICGRRDELIE